MTGGNRNTSVSGSRCRVTSIDSASTTVSNNEVRACTPLLPLAAKSERPSTSSRASASLFAVFSVPSKVCIRCARKGLIAQSDGHVDQKRRPRGIGKNTVVVDHDRGRQYVAQRA